MLPFDAFNRTQIARVATGLYNIQVGQVTMDWALGALESGDYGSVAQLADLVYQRDFGHVSNEAVASRLVHNLNITGAQAAADAMTVIIRTLDATEPAFKGSAVLDMLNMFAEMTNALGYAAEATTFNTNVAAAVEYSKSFPEDVLIVSGSIFTLTEAVVEGEEETPPVTAIYWGYNPNGVQDGSGDEEGPSDGGIPVADLVSFLTTITGLDLHELGLIDDDGVGPFDNVTSLTLSNVQTLGEDASQQLVITFADGSSTNAEVALGEAYFDFLNNLLFDSEGNSRLFEKVIEEGTSGTEDRVVPPKLTPSYNNGGTIESGVTTAGSDTIVAGRLELLHGAYIDGGLGYNILEVDAKGVFAQPLALLNIQEVRVENLPNVYTYYDADTGEWGDDYPWVNDYESSGSGDDYTAYRNSILDLSRATSIERLVVTEGSFEGFEYVDNPGSLTIAGIRNGAVARLEGGFTQNVNLHWGQGQTGPLTVELLLGQVTGFLNFVHNNDSLHLVSLGGGSNSFGSEDIGGRLTQLQISGNAALYINGDLDNSFQDETPVTIDASENTGGVNLELSDSQNVTFIGSQGNDIFVVDTDEQSQWPHNDESVTIIGGPGNNRYEVESYRVDITNGDGNNNYEVDAIVANITAGDGNNHFEVEASSGTLVAGDGDNRFEIQSVNSGDTTDPEDALDYPSNISITVGDGKNDIDIEVDEWIGVANITAGDGGNTIDALGHEVNITTGTSKDTIKVLADKMVINSGGGGDTVTIGGWDYDLVGEAAGSGDDIEGDGAFFQVDLGSGASTVILGNADDYNEFASNTFPFASSITAYPDSFIRGENVTLFVNTIADLQAAELTGITRVILDDDRFDIGDSSGANDEDGSGDPIPGDPSDNALLVLTAEQFAAIGAANFSVEGSVFSTHAYVKIIVNSSTSLTALGVDDLPRGIDLFFEVADGVTLTMTAKQLHERVAPEGISTVDDHNTDFVRGKVVITGAGLKFDPWNFSDTNHEDQDVEGDRDYIGGSLSSDFSYANGNITVRRTTTGYDRPEDDPGSDVLTIDSTGAEPLEQGAFTTWVSNLEIIGDQDVIFSGAIDLGADFTVDWSSLDGEVINLTLANFQDVAELRGNGLSGFDSVVYVQMKGQMGPAPSYEAVPPVVGSSEQGLVSSGVRKLIVVDIDDGDSQVNEVNEDATIYLCDTSLDLEVIGLRGNWNATLHVLSVQWGQDFELQGDGTVSYTTKANGDPKYSNVGSLHAVFEWAGAPAVVNINNQGTDLETRKLHVEGIDIDNAESIAINVEDGDVIIDSLSGDQVETLTITAEQDVKVGGELPSTLTEIDVSAVVGEFTAAFSPDDDFSFVGAEGGSNLTLGEDFTATEDTTIDGGTAGVDLTIGEDADVDLAEATLINVTSVTLEDGSSLSLTMAQAADIGAENFLIADGDTADLNLQGLDGEPFALADYADGITVAVVDVAALPEVTLHPDTDLTGIGALNVHAGTVLNLTAAQYQQLTGAGSIVGIGGTTNFTVNITGLTQDDAEFDDSDILGGTEGLDLSGVLADNLTITMAESIELVATDDLGDFDVVIGDGMTLTLADIQQADGLNIGGGTGTTLKFKDTFATAFESIDASGFDVSVLMILNVLVANRNVDLMFLGLPEGVEKNIYNGEGWVDGVNQTVVIEAGTTVPGFIVFNKPEADVEIQNFFLNLSGGTEIDGNLRLSSSIKNDGSDLIQTHLQTVTINSTGTAENLLTGKTANIIAGDITPLGVGPIGDPDGAGPLPPVYTSVDNNLLDITFNADQDVIVEGSVIFVSVTGDDAITANDDDEAIANLLVTGEADVTLGGLDTSDDDVDGLVVTNNGTGTLSVTLDEDEIDASDDLSFVGTGDIVLTISEDSEIDLSDDDLSAVSAIVLEDNAELTLTQEQFESIGAANITHADFDDTGDEATIHIVGIGEDLFDATDLDDGIVIGSLTIDDGDITLNPATDLTGVGMIIVPEGATLTLTAAQFQQLEGAGTIVGVDADGDPTSDYTVHITGLTQADVDHDTDGDGFADADDGFDLSGVTAADITVSLGEATVTLGTLDDGVVEPGSESDLNGASVVMADNQTLRLVNSDQADGLDISGGTNTTLVFLFDDTGLPAVGNVGTIDASGYDVDFLRALNTFVDGRDVENLVVNLDSSVTLVVYHSPEDLGFVSPTHRVVVIETGVTVPGFIVFNDWQDDVEVRTLSLTMEGDAHINGNLRLSTVPNDPALVPQYFQTLTINSEGDEANSITGDITADTIGVGPSIQNNMLNVVFNLTQDFEVGGAVVFTSVDDDDFPDATMTITGPGDLTIEQLDVDDAEVDSLTIAHNGTGTLTVTGSSPALDGGDGVAGTANVESLIFTGIGDIVFGTDGEGITAENMSVIDASGLSGDLDLGEVNDIDSADFTFTAGTGVTTMMLTSDTLDSTGPDIEPGTSADDTDGWTFDFSNAAAGSELHLGAGLTIVPGSILNIDLGANTTLYIDESMDLSEVDLSILQTLDIVLADGKTLTLNAAQADTLNIVAGPDTGPAGITAKVNVVGLSDDPVDLSGIAANIAGNVTLDGDDVTLDEDTDLGFFTVVLEDLAGDSTSLAGQTIRFQTVAQAERDIVVTPDIGTQGDSSANVVWYFTSISEPVDTSGYDAALGRLWFTATLVNNEGGLVESLFTTLPSTILRVDFATVTELDILLASQNVSRTMELVNFTVIGNLTFSDVGATPEEHIENLTLELGGQVVAGNVLIDDVVAAPDIDLTTIEFDTLTINSHRALRDTNILASEFFVNDNDGINETGETVLPDNINTIGNVGVGAEDGLDLLNVALNTFGVAVEDDGSIGDGAALSVGTITYGYAPSLGDPATEVALLDVSGDNDINVTSVNTSDADITALTLDATGFTAVLTAPGASPAFNLDNTETLIITNGNVGDASTIVVTADAADENDETVTVNYVLNGVAGSEVVDVSGIDVTDATAVAAAVEAALEVVVGITSSVVGATITASGEAGYTFSLTSVAAGGTSTTLAGAVENVSGGTITLGDDAPVNAGIVGNTLSEIDAEGFDGTLNLGIVAQIDSTDDDLNSDGDILDAGENIAFTFTAGDGVTTMTLGTANGRTPQLNTDSTWSFTYTGADAGSALTITDDVIFQTGAILTLVDVPLVIEGDVDLSEVVLNINAGSTVSVPAGQSLTLSVAQALALLVDVEGDGTVNIVGDATDEVAAALGLHLKTVGVDLSGVTLDLVGLDADADLQLDIVLTGGVDDNGDPIGQSVIGSVNDDDITTANDLDNTLNGGGGDDTLTGGDDTVGVLDTFNTYVVASGTDTIVGLKGDGTVSDVITASGGATAQAAVAGNYVATDGTTNNGATVELTAVDTAAGTANTIDMSAAGGTSGYVITGSNFQTVGVDDDGIDTLIGSDQNDTINGGNWEQESAAQADVLTGNDGNDRFVFNTSVSSAAVLGIATTTAGIDREEITLTADDSNEADETLTVNFTVNGIADQALVALGALDSTDLAAVTSAVITALDAKAGIGATAGGAGVVVVTGDNAGSVTITSVVAGGTTGTLAGAIANGTDVAQVTTLTVTGTPTVGDYYSIQLALVAGGGDTADATADATPTVDEIAAGIEATFNDASGVAAAVVTNVVTFTDQAADDGGFELNSDTTAAFAGSGASDNGADDYLTADLITDFVSGVDSISFGLAAGSSGNNYFEAAAVADYATALANADNAFDGTVQYYMTSATDLDGVATTGLVNGQEGAGLLFVDANLDGNADLVVLLMGVTNTTFNALDIVA